MDDRPRFIRQGDEQGRTVPSPVPDTTLEGFIARDREQDSIPARPMNFSPPPRMNFAPPPRTPTISRNGSSAGCWITLLCIIAVIAVIGVVVAKVWAPANLQLITQTNPSQTNTPQLIPTDIPTQTPLPTSTPQPTPDSSTQPGATSITADSVWQMAVSYYNTNGDEAGTYTVASLNQLMYWIDDPTHAHACVSFHYASATDPTLTSVGEESRLFNFVKNTDTWQVSLMQGNGSC